MRTFLGMAALFVVGMALAADVTDQACAGQYTVVTPPYQQTYASHQQTNRRVVEIVTDVLQINPSYASAYSPEGYDSATQAGILSALRQLNARLESQDRATLAALMAKAAAAPVPTPQPAPVALSAPSVPTAPRSPNGELGLAVLVTSCAACHQAGKLAPDQRFTLLDARGGLAPLTDRQKLKVLTRVHRREMPPPDNKLGILPVTDAENDRIVDLLSGN